MWFARPAAPATAADLLRAVEAKVSERLRNEACSQRFDGTLIVDPSKVYIDEATGRRALNKCRALTAPGRQPSAL